MNSRIREARTVKEIGELVAPIVKQTASLCTDICAAPSSVRVRVSASADIEAGTLINDAVTRPVRAATGTKFGAPIDLTGFDHITAAKRAKVSSNLGNLKQNIEYLTLAYKVLRSEGFAKFKGSKVAADSLQQVIADANAKYESLTKIARASKEEIPASHRTAATSIRKYLLTLIDDQHRGDVTINHFVAAATQDFITYQTYVTINNFVAEEGFVYPHYVFVLTTQVHVGGDTGQSVMYLTSIQDLKPPATFKFGAQIRSSSMLKSTVNRLLAIDGTSGFGERYPIGRNTNQLRNASALGLKVHNIGGKDVEIIDGVRVANNKIYIRLAQGMSARERTAAINEVVSIITTMYGSTMTNAKKKAVTTYRIQKGAGGREWMEFSILNSKGSRDGTLTRQQVDEAAALLGMTADQKQNLMQALK